MIDRSNNLLQPRFFPRAKMGTWMENKKRQLELVGPDELLG
jgi:hypothetical protein